MELITGTTGIVGSHLLLERIGAGAAVRALVRPGSDRSIIDRIFRFYRADADELLSRIIWVEGDLLDMPSLVEALEGVKYVYHAAALVSFDPDDTRELIRVNGEGTANLVNAALTCGVKRLCHISSTATIGESRDGGERHEGLPFTEANASPYAASKQAAELEVQRGIAEGLDAVIINPCVVIGPGVKGRSSMTLVERIQGGVRFHPPGSNGVVDARDVARCASLLMDRGPSGERYLAVGENVTYARLFAALSNAFGRPAPTVALPAWSLALTWRLERLRTLLWGRPFITRYTAASAVTRRRYSQAKLSALLQHRFHTLDEMAANVASFQQGRRAY